VPWLTAPVAFPAFSGFFPFSLDTGFFIKTTTADFADYACLFYFLAESFQQAFEALPVMKFYLSQLESTPSLYMDFSHMVTTKIRIVSFYQFTVK
jgi:hypothetical protein